MKMHGKGSGWGPLEGCWGMLASIDDDSDDAQGPFTRLQQLRQGLPLNMLTGQASPLQSSHLSKSQFNHKLTRTAIKAAAATHD